MKDILENRSDTDQNSNKIYIPNLVAGSITDSLSKQITDNIQTNGEWAVKSKDNTFTQPQTVPNATLDGHAINKGQLTSTLGNYLQVRDDYDTNGIIVVKTVGANGDFTDLMEAIKWASHFTDNGTSNGNNYFRLELQEDFVFTKPYKFYHLNLRNIYIVGKPNVVYNVDLGSYTGNFIYYDNSVGPFFTEMYLKNVNKQPNINPKLDCFRFFGRTMGIANALTIDGFTCGIVGMNGVTVDCRAITIKNCNYGMCTRSGSMFGGFSYNLTFENISDYGITCEGGYANFIKPVIFKGTLPIYAVKVSYGGHTSIQIQEETNQIVPANIATNTLTHYGVVYTTYKKNN